MQDPRDDVTAKEVLNRLHEQQAYIEKMLEQLGRDMGLHMHRYMRATNALCEPWYQPLADLMAAPEDTVQSPSDELRTPSVGDGQDRDGQTDPSDPGAKLA